MKRMAMATSLTVSLLAGLSSASMAASTSQTFIKSAIQGDIAEVKAGQVAERNGASDGVRTYGATLVADHTKAQEEATAVAKTLGVKPPTKATPEAQEEYKKLSGMSGAEFNHAFVDAMVMDHQKVIAVFQKEADMKGVKASAMAKAQLPVLEKHLTMAQSLQKE